MPRVRSDSAPTSAAYAAAQPAAAGSSHQIDAPALFGDSSTVAYAATPKNAAVPNETSPVRPTSSSSDSAKISRIMIVATSSMGSSPPTSGNAASASATA